MQSQTKAEKIQILRDTLESKATSTLRVRALDVGKFFKWLVQNGFDPSDISEEECYAYCQDLRIRYCAATSANRFKEALAVVKHVMGWRISQEAVDSPRVQG
eukprot:4361411-Amphidinium_carterae.1